MLLLLLLYNIIILNIIIIIIIIIIITRTGAEIIRRHYAGRPTCHEPIRHQPSASHNATTSQERS